MTTRHSLVLILLLPLGVPSAWAQSPALAPYATTSGDSVNVYLSVEARTRLDSIAPGFVLPNGSIFRTRVAPPPRQKLATAGPNFLLADFNRDGATDLALLGRSGLAQKLVALVSSPAGYRSELLVAAPDAAAASVASSVNTARLEPAGKDGFDLVDDRSKTRFTYDRSARQWRAKR